MVNRGETELSATIQGAVIGRPWRYSIFKYTVLGNNGLDPSTVVPVYKKRCMINKKGEKAKMVSHD